MFIVLILIIILQFQYNIMPGTGRNILVTGGGGYIGSHCILQLLQEDFNVIAVDNFVNSIKGMLILMCNIFDRELRSHGPQIMEVVKS